MLVCVSVCCLRCVSVGVDALALIQKKIPRENLSPCRLKLIHKN